MFDLPQFHFDRSDAPKDSERDRYTTIHLINRFDDARLEAGIWDAIEARL